MTNKLNEIIRREVAKVNSRGRDEVPFRERSRRQQNARITNDNIRLQTRRNVIQGEEIPAETLPDYHLPVKIRKALKQSRISSEDFIIMEQYAKYLPRGKRQLLRLDVPELKKVLVGNVLAKDQLNNRDGLRQGGDVANMIDMDKPKEEILKTLLTQKEQHNVFNGKRVIGNHNYTRIRGLPDNGNPNPTSFINHFTLKNKSSNMLNFLY